MKLGIGIGIDVKKIIKDRLVTKGDKVFLNLTTFIDLENVDQYGQNGSISQSITKDEKEQGVEVPILGNCKIFWTGESKQTSQQEYSNQQVPDDVPF